jgi:3-phenylpropionate/trans-cinnamate dioxygenase ferredoxin subunit
MSGWTRVTALADLEDDRAVRVEVDGLPVCLARSDGGLFAVSDRCTHADISLSEGEVEDGKVECWLHGSQFDLRSGEPLGLPATVAVATYAVKTEGDDVFVDVHPDKHTHAKSAASAASKEN